MENKILDDLIRRLPVLEPCREDITAAAAAWQKCFEGGGKLLICGNGGSEADSQHIVGELMKEFTARRSFRDGVPERLREMFPEDRLDLRLQAALPAMSLGLNQVLTTAYANDADPEMIFAQELYGLGKAGDVLAALSTSGNSGNVLNAVKVARAMGVRVVGICGGSGGKLRGLCDVCILLPEKETYLVQELTMPVYHALCRMVEAYFWPQG